MGRPVESPRRVRPEIGQKIDGLRSISHRRGTMPVIESMELAQVLAEAEDIARNVNQRLTSAHQLLAFFTVPNRAEVLLKERGVDEDRVLLAMTGAPEEPEGAEQTDSLHLLIAMSRVRTAAAHGLLQACGVPLSTLRNVALSYFTAGMPRRLQRVQPVKAGVAPAGPGPRRGPAPAARELEEIDRALDLADDLEDEEDPAP